MQMLVVGHTRDSEVVDVTDQNRLGRLFVQLEK